MTASAASFMRFSARRSLGLTNLYFAVSLQLCANQHTHSVRNQSASRNPDLQATSESAAVVAGAAAARRPPPPELWKKSTYLVKPRPSMRTTTNVLGSRLSGCSNERTYSYLAAVSVVGVAMRSSSLRPQPSSLPLPTPPARAAALERGRRLSQRAHLLGVGHYGQVARPRSPRGRLASHSMAGIEAEG